MFRRATSNQGRATASRLLVVGKHAAADEFDLCLGDHVALHTVVLVDVDGSHHAGDVEVVFLLVDQNDPMALDEKIAVGETLVTTAVTVAVSDSERAVSPELCKLDVELPPMLRLGSSFGMCLSRPRKASILAALLLVRLVLVSVVCWALACSVIFTTTRSLTRKARASVKSSEADRPSCHRLPERPRFRRPCFPREACIRVAWACYSLMWACVQASARGAKTSVHRITRVV